MSGSITALNTIGSALFQAAYEISPILMTGGLAQQIGFDGILPIGALTVSLDILSAALAGSKDALDSFPRFKPLPGSSILNYEIGAYPFANQAVAANAMIAQSINVSLMMINPVRTPGGYSLKLATYMALHYVFQQHIQSGGTFTIATPAFIYFDCLLVRFIDISGDETHQPQYRWQLDFVRPLITQEAATGTLNTFLSKTDSGLQNSGATSGPNVASPEVTTLGSGGANVPAAPLPVPPIPPPPPPGGTPV